MERDPVCGKTLSDEEVAAVDEGTSKFATKRVHEGHWHYFCGLWCRAKFVGGPAAYLDPVPKE